jgi:glycosyltransferase involved in cell wall biosynthesis
MLIPSYFPLVGGAEIQLSGLLQRVDRDRFALFVLTRRIEGTNSADMDGHTPVFRLPAPLCAGTFFFSALRYLWRRRKEYDAIHVFSFDSPALTGAVIKHFFPEKKLILRIPRFGTGSAFDRLTRTPLGRARLRFVLNKADAIIPLCSDATDALKTIGVPEDKLARIPNGVDADYFDPPGDELKRMLKRSFGIAEDAFVGIVVARLIPRKNVMRLLEAWNRVVAVHPDSALIIAGGGPEGPRLSEYAKANFHGRSVIFTGNTSREEVARLLKTADAFVSYSDSEGMSNAMLEAMSSGLPVVAARGPGIDQMVDHTRTGFLFDAERQMDGADYLMRLAEDTALARKMSEAVRGVVESRYSFRSIARDVERLYVGERIAGRKSTPHPEKTSIPRKTPVAGAAQDPAIIPVSGVAPDSRPGTAIRSTPDSPSDAQMAPEVPSGPQSAADAPPDSEVPAPPQPHRSKRRRRKKKRGKVKSASQA